MEAVRVPIQIEMSGGANLVRVIEIRGVGLREAEDGALVLPADNSQDEHRVAGSILRGIANTALIEAFSPGVRSVLTVEVPTAKAEAAGLVCGGSARLLLSPISDLPSEAIGWFSDLEPVVLAARTDGSGGDLAVSPRGRAGSLAGNPGPASTDPELDEAVAFAARQLMRRGVSISEIQTIRGTEVVLNSASPKTRALIVGRGPIADAFKAQGELLGWTVSLTEATEEAEEFCATATAADALIVISHDRSVDVPVLAAALRSPVGYIGAMGSRGTQAQRSQALSAIGLYDHGRICGPIGLDLGSRSPAETAVAMAAEFLALRRGAAPESLSSHSGPIHG